MDRRHVLCGLGTMPMIAANHPDEAPPQGRPPFAWEGADAKRWRFRSWEWRDAAWRPLIGHVAITAGGIVVSGRVDPADAYDLRTRIAAIG